MILKISSGAPSSVPLIVYLESLKPAAKISMRQAYISLQEAAEYCPYSPGILVAPRPAREAFFRQIRQELDDDPRSGGLLYGKHKTGTEVKPEVSA